MTDIAALRDKIAFLEEENRQLRAVILPAEPLYRGLEDIPRAQWMILSALMRGGMWSTARLLGVLDARQRWEAVGPKTVSVHICRLRKRLDQIGVRINTAFGSGYWIDDAGRAALNERVMM